MDACRNPNILSMVTCKASQRKKLLFARYRVWKTFSRERGGGLWWGHCKNDLYGTVHWFYWGCLQLSQSPKPFPCLEDVAVTLTVIFNISKCPFLTHGFSLEHWQSQKHIFRAKLSSSAEHQRKPQEIPKLTERRLVLSLKRASSKTLFITTSCTSLGQSEPLPSTTGTQDRACASNSAAPSLFPTGKFCLQILCTKFNLNVHF